VRREEAGTGSSGFFVRCKAPSADLGLCAPFVENLGIQRLLLEGYQNLFALGRLTFGYLNRTELPFHFRARDDQVEAVLASGNPGQKAAIAHIAKNHVGMRGSINILLDGNDHESPGLHIEDADDLPLTILRDAIVAGRQLR
jgi:hypothetical protein